MCVFTFYHIKAVETAQVGTMLEISGISWILCLQSINKSYQIINLIQTGLDNITGGGGG